MPNLPVPRRSRPKPRVTKAVKEAYVELLAQHGTHATPSRILGLGHNTMCRLRERDPEFKQACEEALELYTDTLKQAAHRRAVEGVDEPIYHQGVLVGYKKRYSDRLLEVMLKKNDPSFRDGHHVDIKAENGVIVVGDRAKDALGWEDKYGRAESPQLPEPGQEEKTIDTTAEVIE